MGDLVNVYGWGLVGLVALFEVAAAAAFILCRPRRDARSVTVTETCIVVNCPDTWQANADTPAAARAVLERLTRDHAERWHPELIEAQPDHPAMGTAKVTVPAHRR